MDLGAAVGVGIAVVDVVCSVTVDISDEIELGMKAQQAYGVGERDKQKHSRDVRMWWQEAESETRLWRQTSHGRGGARGRQQLSRRCTARRFGAERCATPHTLSLFKTCGRAHTFVSHSPSSTPVYPDCTPSHPPCLSHHNYCIPLRGSNSKSRTRFGLFPHAYASSLPKSRSMEERVRITSQAYAYSAQIAPSSQNHPRSRRGRLLVCVSCSGRG